MKANTSLCINNWMSVCAPLSRWGWGQVIPPSPGLTRPPVQRSGAEVCERVLTRRCSNTCKNLSRISLHYNPGARRRQAGLHAVAYVKLTSHSLCMLVSGEPGSTLYSSFHNEKKAGASWLWNHMSLYNAEFYYLVVVSMIHVYVFNVLKQKKVEQLLRKIQRATVLRTYGSYGSFIVHAFLQITTINVQGFMLCASVAKSL